MAHAGLRFGIFLAPFHPVGQNPTLALERDLDLLVHLDALGFDEAWVGEERVVPQASDFYGGWVTSRVVGPFKGEPGTGGW